MTFNRRWLIGMAIYILFGTMAAAVLILNDMQAYALPTLIIYALGFFGGSVAEITKRY